MDEITVICTPSGGELWPGVTVTARILAGAGFGRKTWLAEDDYNSPRRPASPVKLWFNPELIATEMISLASYPGVCQEYQKESLKKYSYGKYFKFA